MPAPAENALELHASALNPAQQILLNQEINARCRFTRNCGELCILRQTNAGARTPLSEWKTIEAANELTVGPYAKFVRHYCMAGKEPFETPDRILKIARRWHETPNNRRCGSLGAISSSAQGLVEGTNELAN